MNKFKPTRGAVAAGHSLTADAGAEILRMGGNAFDAVLAAFLAAGVCEPTLVSLGGGGFMTAYTHDQRATTFDFFVQTPVVKTHKRFLEIQESEIRFGTAIQPQYIGKGTVATPGAVKGVFGIHAQLGKLPVSEVFGPAIRLARTGVEITAYQAYTFRMLEAVLTSNEAIRQLFAPQGHLLREGDRMFQPQLAETLEWLAREGEREFYEGEISRLLLADQQLRDNQGGCLRARDLLEYEMVDREPLRVPVGDYTLLTNPTPSLGGTLLAAGIRLLGALNREPHPESPQAFEDLAHVMHAMDLFRSKRLTSALAHFSETPFPVSEIDRILRELNLWGNTTHISAMDAQGNAASLTASLGGCSGALIPGTGITLNNMLGEIDLLPAGVGSWKPNRRVGSMMAPSVLLNQKRMPQYALGTGGSSRIRTVMLQVVRLLAVHGFEPEKAIAFPRIHAEQGALHLEPGIRPAWFDGPGFERIVQWDAPNMFFGGVHIVSRTADGDLLAAADPRRSGASQKVG